MSLRSVTGTIDSILTLAVLVFCFCIWITLGFPWFIEVGVAAIGLVVIGISALLWTKLRGRR